LRQINVDVPLAIMLCADRLLISKRALKCDDPNGFSGDVR
jgi:hypothetical protein